MTAIQTPRSLKGWNLFYNGDSFAGRVQEGGLPKVEVKVEEYRGAGMQIPVELAYGYEKMEGEITLADASPEFMKRLINNDLDADQLTFRQAFHDEQGGGVITGLAIVRGRFKSLDPGSMKAGEAGELKFSYAAVYYRYEHAGEVLFEIDALNSEVSNGGKSKTADVNRALGLA